MLVWQLELRDDEGLPSCDEGLPSLLPTLSRRTFASIFASQTTRRHPRSYLEIGPGTITTLGRWQCVWQRRPARRMRRGSAVAMLSLFLVASTTVSARLRTATGAVEWLRSASMQAASCVAAVLRHACDVAANHLHRLQSRWLNGSLNRHTIS